MIIKPISRLVQELDAKSITVIGNPCADGLGIDSLRLFHAGLARAQGDLVVIPGDVTPRGVDPFYTDVASFIDMVSPVPVHVMRGNQDTSDFNIHFGYSNRAILSEHFILIMLDNSQKRFSPKTLAFLRETMARVDSHNIIVAFHYPPPNRVSGSSISAEAWKEFEDAVGVWRKRISLLLCGHDHCYYEDDIDGLRMVVAGCGGAKLRRLDRVTPQRHHAVEITLDDKGTPQVTRRVLTDNVFSRPTQVKTILTSIYHTAAQHHVDMHLRGEAAMQAGFPELAKLYHVLSKSFIGQARILHRLLAGDKNPRETMLVPRQIVPDLYNEEEIRDTLDRANDVVAVRALKVVARTEAGLNRLLEAARSQLKRSEHLDLESTDYFYCSCCAMVYASYNGAPEYCHECGAPEDSLHLINSPEEA